MEAIDIGVEGVGVCAEAEKPSCETPLRLTPHIAAQSFEKLAKGCGRCLEEDRELPAILRSQIDRLRQLEGESQPVAKPTTRWWARRPPTRS